MYVGKGRMHNLYPMRILCKNRESSFKKINFGNLLNYYLHFCSYSRC